MATTRDQTPLRHVLASRYAVGLIAAAGIHTSDKCSAVNSLADLPGADGLRLCRERRGAGRDVRVGLLTRHAADGAARKLRAAADASR